MGFRKDAYATVWECGEKEGKNYREGRLSISHKNKDTGEYQTDWSGYARFIGEAKSKSQEITGQTRIKLGDVDVTNFYDKDKKVTYTNYAVFDFDFVDGNQQTESKAEESPFVNLESVGEAELPF